MQTRHFRCLIGDRERNRRTLPRENTQLLRIICTRIIPERAYTQLHNKETPLITNAYIPSTSRMFRSSFLFSTFLRFLSPLACNVDNNNTSRYSRHCRKTYRRFFFFLFVRTRQRTYKYIIYILENHF